MIKVFVYTDKNDCITGFRLCGHAGYANAGKDIVCSAVSMLVINTINSIQTFTSDTFTYQEDEKTATIEFHMDHTDGDSELLLKALKLGLDSVRKEYGKKYIDVKVVQNS